MLVGAILVGSESRQLLLVTGPLEAAERRLCVGVVGDSPASSVGQSLMLLFRADLRWVSSTGQAIGLLGIRLRRELRLRFRRVLAIEMPVSPVCSSGAIVVVGLCVSMGLLDCLALVYTCSG